MKSLTQLKLIQRIKQGLFEYCSLFYTANSRYPTIKELNEAFYIPTLVTNSEESQQITEKTVSLIANTLVEQVVLRAPPKTEFKPDFESKISRGKPVTGLPPEARVALTKGEPLESIGNPEEIVSKMEPWEYNQWASARKKAIESGAPEYESDVALGFKTTKTPFAAPDTASPEEKEVKAGLATTIDRVGEIRTGEKPVETLGDKLMVAVDNITNWLSTGKEPQAGEIESPVVEPPAPPEEEKEEKVTPEEEEEVTPEEEEEVTPEEEEKIKPQEILEPKPEEERKPILSPSPATSPTTEPEEKTSRQVIPKPNLKPSTTSTGVTPSRVTQPQVRSSTSVSPSPNTPQRTKTPPPSPAIAISPAAGSTQPKPGPTTSEIKTDTPDYNPKKSKSDVAEEDYPALRAGIEGINIVRSRRLAESIYDPKKSFSKKEKKQKFKVIVVKEGGKKVEIFASSIRGVKRIIFNQKNFKVYNQSGSEMTSYFKRLKGKNK